MFLAGIALIYAQQTPVTDLSFSDYCARSTAMGGVVLTVDASSFTETIDICAIECI